VTAASDLERLAGEAADCRACDLWRDATQTVFGEGPPDAELMVVGEQPGDREDLAGRPFVGPAGRVLDDALAAAGIDRERIYVTNAVKHFKWRARGKRRIHDKPNRAEVTACRPWLDSELAVVKPRVLVLLGATAAQALLGASFRVTRERGRPVDGTGLAEHVVATVHPSAIVRIRDREERAEAERALAADLRAAAELVFRARPAGDDNDMPNKRANVKNEKQYEALKDKGMSKERAARIANSPDSSSHGGKQSHSGSSRSSSSQGGTTAQKKAAGRKGGKATARKSS
jgi:uracil-DNA glycosylase family protein